MLTLNTNYYALVAQSGFKRAQADLGVAIERLSSGKRINSAKDDAAGMAIANRMTANIRGMQQAARNTNDGISMAQTAEGAISEINNNIQRIRELAVRAANGSYKDEDRASIQKEIDQRLKEIDRIAEQTDFNGTKLLADGVQNIYIQTGAHDGQGIEIEFKAMSTSALGLEGFSVLTTAEQTATPNPLATLDGALERVDGLRGHLGAIQNRFESVISTLDNSIVNLSAARSRIEDTDYAVEISNMMQAQIRMQVASMVLAQANQMPQLVLQLLRDSLG